MLNILIGGGLSLLYIPLNRKIKYEHDYNKLFVALSVVISIIASLKLGSKLQGVIVSSLFVTLLNITFIDLKTREIPDTYNLIVLILGLLNIVFLKKYSLLVTGAFSFILFFIISIFSGGALGGGDIKLSLGIGLFYNLSGYSRFLMFTFGIGSAIALILMLLKKKTKKDTIPFGPFMTIGGILSILL